MGTSPAFVRRAANRIDRWAAGLLYLGLLVVHLGLALTMSGPVVYSDEGGYMGTAHYLASGQGLLYLGAPYHPGYSVLLIPLVRLFPAPIHSYEAALILNAFLLAGVGVGIFFLTRHFVDPNALVLRLCISAVVASYPAFLDYSNLIMAMNLFIPLFVALCVALGRALERNQPGAWFASGALAGALYAIHPVGLVPVAALVIILFVVPRPRRTWVPTTLVCLLGLQTAIIPGVLLMREVVHHNQQLLAVASSAPAPGQLEAAGGPPVTAPAAETPGSAPPTTARPVPTAPALGPQVTVPIQQDRTQARTALLRRSLSLSRLVNNAYELAGQMLYLCVGTYGLWPLGIAVALGAAWRVVVRRRPEPGDHLAVFIGLVMLATLASSTLLFNSGRNGTREADELIYGRYNELVLAPTIVLGLVALRRLRSRGRRANWQQLTWPLGVGALLAACAAGVGLGRSRAALHAVLVDVNVMGLHPLLSYLGGIDVVALALCGLAAVTIVVLLARWLGLVAVAVPVVVLCVLSASVTASSLSRESLGRTGERVIVNTINAIAQRFGARPSCVAYDVPVEHEWNLSNDQFFMPAVQFRRFDSKLGQRPCSPYVISARWDLSTQYPGARVITPENLSATKLWIMPGPLLDEVQQAGLALPASFPAALPASACHSSLKLIGAEPGASAVPYEGHRDVIVSVTNRGIGSPWPSRLGFDSGEGWVRLEVIWVALSNPLVPLAESSGDLPRTVFPAETVEVNLRLVARGLNGAPLPTGEYAIRIGLVQDGFTYFTDKGDHTLDIGPVDVARPPAARKTAA